MPVRHRLHRLRPARGHGRVRVPGGRGLLTTAATASRARAALASLHSSRPADATLAHTAATLALAAALALTTASCALAAAADAAAAHAAAAFALAAAAFAARAARAAARRNL